jgi:hypothetical protein
MKIIASVEDAQVIGMILAHLEQTKAGEGFSGDLATAHRARGPRRGSGSSSQLSTPGVPEPLARRGRLCPRHPVLRESHPQWIVLFGELLEARQPMHVSIHIILLDGIPVAELITGVFGERLYALHCISCSMNR